MAEGPKTVQIVCPADSSRPMIINESDYDPKKHKLWTSRSTAIEDAPAQKPKRTSSRKKT